MHMYGPRQQSVKQLADQELGADVVELAAGDRPDLFGALLADVSSRAR